MHGFQSGRYQKSHTLRLYRVTGLLNGLVDGLVTGLVTGLDTLEMLCLFHQLELQR